MAKKVWVLKDVFMKMKSGLHCYAEMSYASILEKEAFPQTLILVEGDNEKLVANASDSRKGMLVLQYQFAF